MKKYILIFMAMTTLIVSHAQSPSGFQYQAIVRDGQGNALSNKSVSLRISLLEDQRQVIWPIENHISQAPMNLAW